MSGEWPINNFMTYCFDELFEDADIRGICYCWGLR